MSFRRFLRATAVVLLSLLVLGSVFTGYFLIRRQISAVSLDRRSELLKRAYTPLRVLVLSRSDRSVSARCFLYDADGREIASFERSWNGYELEVESSVVPLGGHSVVFPKRISGGSSFRRSGTELYGYYDRKGFPSVYSSSSLDPSVRSSLSYLFFFTRTFGGGSRDVKILRDFEVGYIYSLTTGSDGRVAFERE